MRWPEPCLANSRCPSPLVMENWKTRIWMWALSRGYLLCHVVTDSYPLGHVVFIGESELAAYDRLKGICKVFQPSPCLTYGVLPLMPFSNQVCMILCWNGDINDMYIRLHPAHFQQKCCRLPLQKTLIIEWTYVEGLLCISLGTFFWPSHQPLSEGLVSPVLQMRKETESL